MDWWFGLEALLRLVLMVLVFVDVRLWELVLERLFLVMRVRLILVILELSFERENLVVPLILLLALLLGEFLGLVHMFLFLRGMAYRILLILPFLD